MSMSKQLTDQIVMVRPAHFGFNEETATNNKFQTAPSAEEASAVSNKAVMEFDTMVKDLRDAGVEVLVHQDDGKIIRPDSIFPNNWISMHADGKLITYPMFAPLRRNERSEELINRLGSEFDVSSRIHFENFEDHHLFLEGTGSMVFDHDHRIIYACRSQRTMEAVLEKVANVLDYEVVTFDAHDQSGYPVYHTNVMMAMGVDFVVICLDSVDKDSRENLIDIFSRTGKDIIEISLDQMNSFAGNMIQLKTHKGERLLVMSQSAFDCLNPKQRELLGCKTRLFPVQIPTIEKTGGGSARCMIAENFLTRKD